MHPRDKIQTQLHQDVVYQWTCANENCNSYTGESSGCLESRVKECNTSFASTIFQHCTTQNHPKGNIFQFKIIDQDRKQVSREAIHIRRNNPALIQNIGKLNIPEILNHFLGITHNTSTDVSTKSNAQQNPSSSQSNRATRETNLHN